VLLSHGASVTAEDHLGLTPAEHAEAFGHSRLLQLLQGLTLNPKL
jgi:ankyrin repeat protein